MSIVEQHSLRRTLTDHVKRIRDIERGGSQWIYVGTTGVDGVDGLLGPESPPFQNGWTNTLGDEAPVAFTIFNGWVHLRGGYSGGADGTVVFTLPAGYRPKYRQEMILPTTSAGHFATCVVGTDGTVVFGAVV